MFNKTISVTISSNYLFDTIYDSNQKKKEIVFITWIIIYSM